MEVPNVSHIAWGYMEGTEVVVEGPSEHVQMEFRQKPKPSVFYNHYDYQYLSTVPRNFV